MTTFTYLDATLKVKDSTGSNPFTTTLSSNSLSSTSTFDISVPSLKLNDTPSTQSGQVITSNSAGQPIWATPAITLGSSNTWSGTNSFTNVLNTMKAETPTAATNDNTVSTTAYVTSAISTLVGASTTWSGTTNTFKAISSTETISATKNISTAQGITANGTIESTNGAIKSGNISLTKSSNAITIASGIADTNSVTLDSGIIEFRKVDSSAIISSLDKEGLAFTNSSAKMSLATTSTVPTLTLEKTTTEKLILTPIGLSVGSGDSASYGTDGQVLTRTGAGSATSYPYGWKTPAITLGSDNTWSGINTFTTPPQSVPPVLGTDLSTKGYVDSMAGQYGGGLNLFMNNFTPSTISTDYRLLSKTVSSAAQQTVTRTLLTLNQEVSIAKFMSEPLGVSEIPIGLWDMIIYGSVDNIDGNINYYYKLHKYSGGVIVLPEIGQSSLSPDVNTVTSLITPNPTSYPSNLTISSPVTLNNTDRVYIELFAKKTTGTASVVLTTYFEGGYYSYVGTSLNAGTTLLGSENTWTAKNSFGNISFTPSTSTLLMASTVNGSDKATLTAGSVVYSSVNSNSIETTVNRTGISGIYNTTKKFSLALDEPGGILTLEKSTSEKVILTPIALSVGSGDSASYGTDGQVLTRTGAGSATSYPYGWKTPAITLSSTNTWTGTNTFNTDTSFLSIKTPSINGVLLTGSAVNTPLTIGDLQTGSSGTIDIGGNASRTGNINIGNGAGATTNTSTINLSNATSAGVININRPLTIGYIPLAIGTMGATNTKIGNRYLPTLSSATATTSGTAFTTTNMCSFNVPIGVWICTLIFYINTLVQITRLEFSVSPTSVQINGETVGGANNINQGGIYVNNSNTIVNNTSANQTWYATVFCSVASIPIIDLKVVLTRIA